MNVVASPDCLARHARPETPQDLEVHNCIRLRFPSGEFLPWRFIIEGETLELDVKGSLIANDADLLVHVALNGTGVVYVFRDFAAPFIATGQLAPLLEEWMPPPSDGFFLYYPSRRQNLASLRAFIEFLLACMVKLSGKELPVRNRDGLAADHDAIAFDSDADEPAIRTISDPIRRIP